MIIVLPLLMAFELIGRATHEWLGVSMLLLVIVHQGLNWKWYRNLLHGKYTAMRAVTLVPVSYTHLRDVTIIKDAMVIGVAFYVGNKTLVAIKLECFISHTGLTADFLHRIHKISSDMQYPLDRL